MMAPTIQLLRDLGVPAEQIKSEEFIAAKKAETTSKDAIVPPLPATPVMMPDTNAEPMLTFSRSGKSVALDPDKCLLEIAEEAGVNTDYGCRSGICGRCKTRLLRGNVTMEFQDALDEDEKSKNIILMCQARATERVTVEA
jgi:ferredoxin